MPCVSAAYESRFPGDREEIINLHVVQLAFSFHESHKSRSESLKHQKCLAKDKPKSLKKGNHCRLRPSKKRILQTEPLQKEGRVKNVGSGWFVGQQKLRWPVGWLVGALLYCWSEVSIL